MVIVDTVAAVDAFVRRDEDAILDASAGMNVILGTAGFRTAAFVFPCQLVPAFFYSVLQGYRR